MSRGMAGAGIGSVVALVVLAWLWWPAPYVNPPVMAMADRPAPMGAPNVVFVLGCTVRRDQLSPYGGAVGTTPFLARLASGGVRFEDAVAASSWTKASTVAAITGRHALSLGLVEPDRGRNDRALDPSWTTLAEHFVAAGYETAGVTANPNLNTAFGLAQGFDQYRDVDGRIVDGKLSGDAVVERALAMVDQRRAQDRPLYLRAMFVDAHVPREGLSVEEIDPHRGPNIPPQLAEYRAQLHRFDRALSALYNGLEARGIHDGNTLWVVVADHGEGLDLAPNHRGHGRTLYGSMLRVPWIVHGPGVPPGGVVEGLASLIDLPRTLSGLVGMDGPSTGFDWSEQVRGRGSNTTRERVFADTWFYEVRRSAIWSQEKACQVDFGTTGATREDLWFESGCFDRARDVAFRNPHVDHAMMRELSHWRAARLKEGEGWSHGPAEFVSDDLSEQLESLGYVE
jgi:arylsulfatase A-like enzyme